MKTIELIFAIFKDYIIFIIFLIIVFLILLQVKKNINLNNKFKKYTINSINESENLSLFDLINNYFNKLVKLFSFMLKHIRIFNKSTSKYDKYIDFEDLNNKEGIDFISEKFILSIATLMLYIISILFQAGKITFIGVIVSILVGYFILDIFIQIEYRRKRRRIEEDLLKAIVIMNNAFKSGKSTIQAIEVVGNELDGPISNEFKKIYLDLSYGLSMETVFDRFYNRVKLEDAKYITSSLTVLNKTGGNIVKVFASIEKDFMNRKKLINELKTMTASNVFVFKILLGMPFFLFAVIFILNNDYFNPLVKNNIGIFIILIILFLYALYIIIIKNILRIDI